MKILVFDIETYREHFCFVGKLFDGDTKQEIKEYRVVDKGGIVSREHMAGICTIFQDCDYIVSYNGKKFDLPVLAKLKDDLKRLESVPVKFIYQDAQALIAYDDNNNPIVKRHKHVDEWSAKHFDLLNNCLLRYSLKQWEMYEGYRIRELPYAPDANLTPEMIKEIDDYCAYDVWATAQIFWKYGWDTPTAGRTTLLAYRQLMKWWPEHLPFRFDRTSQEVAAYFCYEQSQAIPPKTNAPLNLFDLNSFDVPLEVKMTIGYIAKAPNIEFETTYKGIQFGKGGAHYIKPGHHKKVYAFDFASLYPFIIGHWQLLKTKRANDRYAEKRDYRLWVKHHKKGNEELINEDRALKLFLNAPTGALRMKGTYNMLYDPAAGEAMCYIGQLLIAELAFACPEWDKLLEINTDSVFVQGEPNIEACRRMIDVMNKKYGLILEEEYMPEIYVRDVNNYLMYDENRQVTGGKGHAYSDIINKHSNMAMYQTLFASLISDKVERNWTKYGWRDFIVKYHKSSASKYAMIDNKKMEHKNYYFMWTTRDCPDSVQIGFSRDLIDSKNGAIKARWGVWSQDMQELEKYFQYIDFEQYDRDLDVELTLWHREDLVTTHLTKYQRKTIKSFGDLIRQEFI